MNIKKPGFLNFPLGKNKILLVLGMLVCSSIVFGATTLTDGDRMLDFYQISLTMVNQEPDPGEAGRYVTVRFKLENTGRENAEDIMLELLPTYPFSLDPGESAVKSVGSLYSGQSGEIGVIKDYRVKVDESALEGDNKIEVQYKIKDQVWIKETFYINIRPHSVLLDIAKIDTPKMIAPGEVSKVDVNLKNLAFTFIKDIKVTLNLDGSPFATIGSTNRKIIKQMGAESEKAVSFSLMAEPDAESKLYKIPIEIEFLDRLGTVYTKNETVGLIIGAEPDLSISVDASEIYKSGESGEVTIKITNKGVTDVKFLNIILKESDNLEILSQKEVYVGNIDSDDYETSDFRLTVKKTKENEVILPLLVEYKDSNNNDYSEEVDLPLRIYSSSEAKALDGNGGSSKVGIFIVLLIVGVGIFLYIRWRKKKSKK